MTHPQPSSSRGAVRLLAVLFGAQLAGCQGAEAPEPAEEEWETLEVTATAYNTLPEQTHPDHPTIAAWGDELEPGMQVIAVSPDLVGRGLTRGTEVRIDGLEGTFVVLDRMPSRWRQRIDIYMDEDVGAARRWGRQTVEIRWRP